MTSYLSVRLTRFTFVFHFGISLIGTMDIFSVKKTNRVYFHPKHVVSETSRILHLFAPHERNSDQL